MTAAWSAPVSQMTPLPQFATRIRLATELLEACDAVKFYHDCAAPRTNATSFGRQESLLVIMDICWTYEVL
jgi:hypothetical protein